MSRIRVSDEVIIIAGKDKGKISRVLRRLGNYLIVEGINIVKKHVKPNPDRNIKGGIQEKEMKMHISNVAHYNPSTNKPDRVGFRILEGNKRKVRYYKSTKEVVDTDA